jgi:type VI secretion system protein VasG
MAEIKRSTLFGKLNSFLYKSIEGATVFCKMRGNPYVELVHWINQILQAQDSDLHQVIRHYGLNSSKLASDLTNALDSLPRGATSISDFSPHLEQAVERAWVYGTLLFDTASIRSGILIYGILETPGLRNVLNGMSGEFAKIKPADLAENFGKVCSASPEERLAARETAVGGGVSPGEASGAMPPAEMGKQEALHRFSVDLTEQARSGKMDPILGRDDEIRQIIDILMRRRQNNPILTGEAGVGKTAVVEGFAQKIVSGDVPPMLRDVTLRTLDLGLLQAGASMKGEFENRLRQVIEEVQASPRPIILFIDEAHTLVGAGGAAGQGDAANLLKPALARGTLRTVAATTWAEYKKYFEKDPALTRRFQVVKIDEPDEAKACIMIRGLSDKLQQHHKVRVLDEAVSASVSLSHRYIPARQLPDKAVSLIDTACARVAIGQHSVPATLEDSRRRIQNYDTELRILDKEIATGRDHAARKAELEEARAAEIQRREALEARWEEEKRKVEMLLALHDELRDQGDQPAAEAEAEAEAPAGAEATPEAEAEAGDAAAAAPQAEAAPAATEQADGRRTRAEILDAVRQVENELAALQGESPLILPYVDEQAVASVVADWTGIPVGRMVKDEIKAVLNLVSNLEKRVIGQTHAMEAIAKRIQTSRARLDNPKKPIGVFLLAGTSGVGKTETALAVAETLYGGETNLITINMSEFQEAHTVSTLKGAPPGYVGYGEGGVLTEAVRRRPYSVVLLDEVEKAHPDVHEIFFQVFDKGEMEDGEGRMIDFRNTVILLTTNAGSELIMSMCKDPDLMPDPDGIAEGLKQPLLKVFPAALLGRMLTVPFYPLSRDVLKLIIRLQLNRIKSRVESTHKIPFLYDEAVVDLVLERCNNVESGGRIIDAILTNTLLPAISREFLTRMMEGNPPAQVKVSVENGDFAYAF